MATVITGTEWLEHRGSVGRPISGEMQILDDDGNACRPARRARSGCGATAPATRRPTATSAPRPGARDGGWESLGDIGWLDEDGYLYLGDRMQDMILVGGANVYPAEVEAALLSTPACAARW